MSIIIYYNCVIESMFIGHFKDLERQGVIMSKRYKLIYTEDDEDDEDDEDYTEDDEEGQAYYASMGQKRYYPQEVEDYISNNRKSLSFDQRVEIYNRCQDGFLAVIHTLFYMRGIEPRNSLFTDGLKKACNMLCKQFGSPEMYPELSDNLKPEDYKFTPDGHRPIVTDDMIEEAFRRYAPRSKRFKINKPT